MFASSLNSEHSNIRTDSRVISNITNFELNGSTLEIAGFASITGLNSYQEDRIRKTLLLVPKVDIDKFREKHQFDEQMNELTDEEIKKSFLIHIPLNNCTMEEIQSETIEELDENALNGFYGQIDLSTITDNKPLHSGSYQVYVQLEQLSNDNDDVKHVKTIALANMQEFLRNGLLTTKLHYYSAKRILKYNLMVSFDAYNKTLLFENTLLQSYNPKELNTDEAKSENRYIQAIKRRFFKIFYIVFSLLPINHKKVTFASDSRTDLSGNLYFIYEELYRRDLHLNIKFIFNESINNKKSFFQLFKTSFHIATSKIILLDDFYPLIYPLKIRRKADLIQVWHAAGAFKTFGFSRLGRPGGPSPRSRNHRNYTKATVSSEGVREHYAEGFGIDEERIYPTGVPRSDIFFDADYKEYVVNVLYNKYPFLKDKKVILFAPTFRGNGQASAHFPFETIDMKGLYEELHEEYVFLFKIHPFVKNKLTIPYEYQDFFYDLSEFREINDLLLVTDVLLTDYSSVCFEFALLNKPMLFFAFDVEKYIQERDFYYDFFDFIPGPLIKTSKEIIDHIKHGEFDQEKMRLFVEYFFGDTLGKASQNVVDQVIIPSLENQDMEDEEEELLQLSPPKSRIELFERSLGKDELDEKSSK